MNTTHPQLPRPSHDQQMNMALLCEAVVKEAIRIGATNSEVVSAALSIVGGSSIEADSNNKRAIVASLRELANLIEGGQLSANTRTTLASAKASTLH